MYARELPEQTLTFRVSGKLWEGSLVMLDSPTGTLWSHILGAAVEGPLRGTELEVLPSTMTSWGAWRERNPDTTVAMMPRSSNRYRVDAVLLSGVGIGLRTALADGPRVSRAWGLEEVLYKGGVLNDRFQQTPVAVAAHEPSLTLTVFSRVVDGEELTLEMEDGELVDREHHSRWDPISGKALGGPWPEARLENLGGIISDGAAWSLYHPESTRAGDPNTPPAAADSTSPTLEDADAPATDR